MRQTSLAERFEPNFSDAILHSDLFSSSLPRIFISLLRKCWKVELPVTPSKLSDANVYARPQSFNCDFLGGHSIYKAWFYVVLK